MSIRPVHLTRQLSVGQSGFDRTLTLKQRDLVRLQEQLATGKRVNRASDDASAFEAARRMENLGERYGQYQDAIMRSRGWVNQNQDTLDQIAELLTMAYEKGIDAQDETHSPDDLAVVAESVDAYFEEILDQLNTRVEGEYLFAGTDTLATPFQAVDVAGTQVVNYLGNSGARTRAIGPGINLDINITGDHVLDTGQGFTITESLTDLSAALRGGDPDQIATAVDRVQAAQEHVLGVTGEAGIIANRLDLSDEHLSFAVIQIENQRSLAEDADLAETVTRLQEVQLNLEAAYHVVASVQQTTILDYLR